MNNLNEKKRQIIAAICAAAIVCFTSCGKKSEITTNDDSNSQVPYNTDSYIENRENSETHIYKEYSENFIVDTDIISPYREQANVLLAKRYVFEKDKILSLFFDGKNPKITEYPDGHIYFDAMDSDGSYAYFDTSYLDYVTNHRLEVQLSFENFSTNENFYCLVPRYYQVYKKDSLDFMNPNEAISRVKEVLSEFNINVSDNVEIYAMDCETMQEYQDYFRENNPDSAMNYRIKENLTKDDEFYFMCFSVEQEGIPVTRYTYNHNDRTVLFGSNIKVCFSKDGIFEFHSNGIYNSTDTERFPDNLLTAEQALDKAFEQFNSDYSNAKARVEQMRFEYVMESIDSSYDEVKLKPIWSLIVYQEVDNPEAIEKAQKKKEKNYSDIKTNGKYDITSYSVNRCVWMIDAETGEVIANNK